MKLPQFLIGLCFMVCSIGLSAKQQITPNVLPANKNATSIVDIDQFGRYIIQAKSDQGVAFGLNDKKYGKSQLYGQAAKQDGRYSGFLDVGQYQLFTSTVLSNTNTVNFDIKQSTAINNTDDLLILPDSEIQTIQLQDTEHYDWAINIEQAQMVNIEAAGRNLEHLQLFQNGQWLVESTITKQTIDPVVGKPLTRIRLSVYLQPGIYRLSAYGGVSLKWANEDDSHPLYLRKGFADLNVNAKDFLEVSPFGEDFYLIETGSDYFQVNLAKNNNFELGVANYSDEKSDVFTQYFERAKISQSNKTPVASLNVYANSKKIISVKSMAKQTYQLINFKTQSQYGQFYNQSYIISSMSANSPNDYADVTGYISQYNTKTHKNEIVHVKAIALNQEQYYARKFNVLKKIDMLINIEQAGVYHITNKNNLKVKFKIEPFLLYNAKNNAQYKTTDLSWDLNKGYYRLTIEPVASGVLDLNIHHSGYEGQSKSFDANKNTANLIASAQMFFAINKMSTSSRLTLFDNGNINGVDIRKSPVNLDVPFNLILAPNQIISFDTIFTHNGQIVLAQSIEKSVSITLDGKKYSMSQQIIKSNQSKKIEFKNTSNQPVEFTVKFISNEIQTKKSATRLKVNATVNYDKIDVNTQPFINLHGGKTYSMQVDEPGLYAVESTGLLSTTGVVRNKLNDKYQDLNHSGTGRNFYIQPYLLAGEYQLKVNTQGSSHGNLGLKLAFSKVIDKGEIKLNAKYYETLKSTQVLKYELNVKQTDRYRIQSYAVDQTMQIRLDDADGWPVIKPYSYGDQTIKLNAGKYIITILPNSIEQMTSLLVEPVPEEPEYSVNDEVKNIDIHQMSTANKIRYTWLEREDAQGQRLSDRWQFTLNTPSIIEFEYSDTMNIALTNLSTGKDIALFDIKQNYNTQNWQQRLSAGEYELSFMAKGKNNLLGYEFSVFSTQLLFGQQQIVNLPYKAKFELAKAEQINFSTYGMSDVKAKLFDEDNQLISQFDDTQKNWNVLINSVLDAGLYKIELQSISQAQITTLRYDKNKWSERDAQSLPINQIIKDEASTILPLVILDELSDASVLNLVAQSKQSVYVVVEELQFNSWQQVASQSGENIDILLPIRKTPKPLRLKLFSLLNQPLNIALKATIEDVPVYDGSAFLKNGLVGKKILNASNWYVAKIEDVLLSGYQFNQDVMTSFIVSQSLSGRDSFIYNENNTMWVAANNASIQASMQYLQNLGQVQIKPNSKALLINQPLSDKAKINVTRANVVQDFASIFYDTKSQDKQNTMAIDGTIAVTSTLNVPVKDQVLTLKNALDPNYAILVKLQHFEFDVPNKESFKQRLSSKLNVNQSLAYQLNNAGEAIQVVLPAKTLVQFVLDKKIQASFYHHLDMQTVLYSGGADAVYLFSMNDQSQPFSIETIKTFETNLSDENEIVNTHRLDAKKILTSEYDVTNPKSIRQVIEISHDSILLDENMNVQFGKTFNIQNDAKMYIHQTTIPTILWQSSVFIDVPSKQAMAQNLKDAFKINAKQYLNVDALANQLLEITSDQMISVELIHKNGSIEHELIDAYQTKALFIGKDVPVISMQRVNQSSINQTEANIFTNPIKAQILAQGVNPLSVMASNQSQLYQFNMTHTGSIGFANRSDSDQLGSRLYDESGMLLVQANVLMQAIKPGTYYVVVKNNDSNQAVQFEPVILGLTENDAIDSNLINEYKQKAGWVK
ncbi:hypothetical protein [Marinicellulosiphila megalodicopiae]|uniref:hypothetical protein n=1 Tax=Marinicellulosiphila megalodicopiae TaxID=2724896 RepID=UPI003BAFE7F9